MKEILLSTYSRKDPYEGRKHYHTINRHHTTTEIRCYQTDNSEEREMGILVNKEEMPDYYDIVEFNHKGERIWRYHFTDTSSANKCFLNLMEKYSDFKKAD